MRHIHVKGEYYACKTLRNRTLHLHRHHSLSATLAIALLLFGQINITYKKWYCTLFGFTCYLTLGAFLIGCMGLSDAFHIYTPLISDTPLTTWVIAPIYAVCYALLLLSIELVRKHLGKKNPQNK